MTATIELNSARKKLSTALVEGSPSESQYFGHLKNWFRKRISKENFDTEARKLLAKEHAHLHNEFLLAILNKCQTLANFTPSPASISAVQQQQQQQLTAVQIKNELATMKPEPMAAAAAVAGQDRIKRGKIKTKRKSSRPHFDQRFQRVVAINGELEVNDTDIHDAERTLRFAFREPMMPDVSMIHGRMIVTAWEERLEGVEDSAVEIIVKAVENQLRTMVMALVMKRRGYRLKDGRFPHAVGAPAPNPWLLNSQNRIFSSADQTAEVSDILPDSEDPDPIVPVGKPTVEEAEQKAIFELACSNDLTEAERNRRPISLFDLMRLMQERKSIIPCHSVYAKNLERCIARLQHCGHDD